MKAIFDLDGKLTIYSESVLESIALEALIKSAPWSFMTQKGGEPGRSQDTQIFSTLKIYPTPEDPKP